ncbi:MAG: rhomboid family intramembrane serine protease [Methyloceanibacter sp.]
MSAAAGLMAALQFIRGFLPDELDLTVLLALAFIPARYSGAALELPGGYLTCVTSFVTYMVVHGGWVHLLVNVLWMLAFGTAVARRIGGRSFFVFSILCGIAGALTHLAFHYGAMAPVVGASAAVSGQMAGALRFIFWARRNPGERLTSSMHLLPVLAEHCGTTEFWAS